MSESTHLFLSDGWIDAARELRNEFADRIPDPPVAVKLNVIITEIPHRDEDLDGHIDSSSGELIIERGHIDEPELTITVDYATAISAFVTRDQQAVMQAFLGGKIFVEGDASRLLMLQASEPTGDAIEMYQRLAAITADVEPEGDLS